ncbi:hypothetical protein LOAG_03880 [Loa loa]|uniref:Uncharacterized protein n=1 Tax=Loa loa TaxID=7209 RepID=A0A1S0U3L8_LOALO|nr:hypothetical protein LOAG_03880 [Loa loa]EFO24601.1 hypothetical protein LOAG_03880 [Loa loa]
MSESPKSDNYEVKKHGRREKLEYSEGNQKRKKNNNIHSMRFNKLNSRSIQKYESRKSHSENNRNSWKSNVLDKRSYKICKHVELIRRQARHEKRILEEWNSVISDLGERCHSVSFERLKLLLNGNDYSYVLELEILLMLLHTTDGINSTNDSSCLNLI